MSMGGKRPVCPCGCGHELNLRNGGKRWEFTKYYADTCYGRLVKSCNDAIIQHSKLCEKKDFDVVQYYESKYDRKTYEEAFKLLKTKEFSLVDIAQSYKIDKRTLKKVWLAMGITDSEELTELLEYTKYKLSVQHNNATLSQDENMMSWMYNMIKTHPAKYTIHQLLKLYNHTYPDKPCMKSDVPIAQSLIKIYGDEVDFLLAKGYHSSEEYTLYTIFKHYLPDYRIKMGKRFILDGDYIYYDFCIGSRVLIEYDSSGKFHQDDCKEQDIKKEKFAIENGYTFIRLTKKESQDIKFLFKLQKLLANETN